MKSHLIRFGLLFAAVFAVGCSYSTEPIDVPTYYTVRYYDDATTPKECGFSYFLLGQSAIFHAESGESEYGSVYANKSVQTAAVGHYFVFDGWYFKDALGNFSSKANLNAITAEYIEAHGVDTSSSSSSSESAAPLAGPRYAASDSSSSDGSSTSSDTSSNSDSSSESSSSGAKNYSIANKELRVYAHFVDRRYSLTVEFMDGVDYARNKSNGLVDSKTVAFGAGTGEKISGPAYFCPHCHYVSYDGLPVSGTAATKKCKRCGTEMEYKSGDFDNPMYSIYNATDYETDTGSTLTGHPGYGYVSGFQGWSLQKDFVDADGDGNADTGYNPGVFTEISSTAKFTGDDSHSATSLPDLTDKVAGDLFLDGHIGDIAVANSDGTTTTKKGRINGLYCCSVLPDASKKWVKIGTLSETSDPVLIFLASYTSSKGIFSLNFFSGPLADGITSSTAKESPTYLGDSYTLSTSSEAASSSPSNIR